MGHTVYKTVSSMSISPDGITWTPIATIDSAIELVSTQPEVQQEGFSLSDVKVKFKLHMTRKQRIWLFKLAGVPHGFRRASRRAQKRDKMKQHRM